MKKIGVLMVIVSIILVESLFATGTTEKVADKGKITVDFWSLLTGGSQEVLKNQVDAFNASQNEVFVDLVAQGGYSELQQKLLASINANNTPVITMVDYMFIPFYASQGVFEPLDGYLGTDVKDFIPGLLADLKYNGGIYALPYNRSTQGFYYNKDLFAKAGLTSAPKTWEEFREDSLKIKKLGDEYYGGFAFFNRWYFEPIMEQWGVEINDKEGNVTFNTAKGVEAMKFFQDLYKDGLVAMQPTLSGGFQEQCIEYVAGRVASTLQSTSWLTRMEDSVDFNWEFAFLPAGPNGHVVTNGGANFAISKRATQDEKDAAWTFLNYMTSTEQSSFFHQATGYMPVRYSVLALPEIKELHKKSPKFRVSIDQLEFARETSIVAKNCPNYQTVINDTVERILVMQEDPKKVLDWAAKQLQEVIDEARASGTLVL